MYGFEAVTFAGKRTARKALDTLEDHAPAYGWIDDVAVVSRGRVRSSQEADSAVVPSRDFEGRG